MKLGWVTSPAVPLIPQIIWGTPYFDFIEIQLGAPHADPNKMNIPEFSRVLSEVQKPIFVCAPRDLPMNSSSEALRSGVQAVLLEALSLTQKINGRLLSVTYAGRMSTYGREQSAKAYGVLLNPVLDATEGVYIGLRNGLENRDQLTDLRDVLQSVPRCVTALDVGNAHLNVVKNLTPEYLYDRDIGTRLAHVYLSDNNGKYALRLPPGSIGEGGIDWQKIIRSVKQAFNATISLDIDCTEPDYLLLARDKVRSWWDQL